MTALVVLVVLGVIIAVTAYACRDCDGQLPDDHVGASALARHEQ
jgi:hypothetical protein